LKERVKDHERAVAQLKRARNSLLNVSKLPPEVLGNVFRWNVTRKHDFAGLEKESHNFLLVCHHWFEVASCAPELWGFWGNTPMDWARWCHHSATTPLDLVLDADVGRDAFNSVVRSVLRDRANRDTIRLVHLRSADPELLSSVISSLTADREGLRSSSVESFILYNDYGDMSPDVSYFFARYLFPKLQHLELTDCEISSWDRLLSRTGALTTLDLDLGYPSPAPTTSQLLSILTSNPALQKISLSRDMVPNDSGDNSSLRVSLHYLKELKLAGYLQNVFRILHRLDHPGNMEWLYLVIDDCTVADISQIVGPYLRDYLRRRGSPQGGLGLFVSWHDYSIRQRVGDVCGFDLSTPVSKRVAWFVSVDINLDETLPNDPDLLEKVSLDLVAHTPREDIVYLQALRQLVTSEAISTQFTNITTLHLYDIPLSALFPESNRGGIFASLERIFLDMAVVDGGDWTPLVTSLAHRASCGKPLDTLEIYNSPHMCTQVVEGIRGVVRKFQIDHSGSNYWLCPFGTCPKPTLGFCSPSPRNPD
jgi:hypothetical protein